MLHRTAVLLSLFCLLAPFPASAAQTPYDEFKSAFELGDYSLASLNLRKVIDSSADWAPGHAALAQCYFMLGKTREAEESLARAKELDSATDLFAVYAETGRRLNIAKRHDEAAPLLERALEHEVESKRREPISLLLGYARFGAGRFGDARRAFEDHERNYELDLRALELLALSCRSTGDYRCALSRLREAQEAEPGNRKRLERLGKWSHYWALLPENQSLRRELLEQAVEDTALWYEADSDNPEAFSRHAEARLAAGHSEPLRRWLEPLALNGKQACAARLFLSRDANASGEGARAVRWARHVRDAKDCRVEAAAAQAEEAVGLLRQLPAEHSSLEEVAASRSRLNEVLTLVGDARAAEYPKTERLDSLETNANKTLEALGVVEQSLRSDIDDYDDAVDKQVNKRCLSIYWMRKGDGLIGEQDELYYTENHCKERVKATLSAQSTPD